MASTALVRDLLWRASVLLGDTLPQFQRFTERELVMWLNDGQVAIAKYMPSASVRSDAIKLVPGTRQSINKILQADIVPGDGVALTAPVYGVQLLGLVRNMGVDGVTAGKSITKMERTGLDDFDEDWHTKTGLRVVNYAADERTPNVFYVTPGVPGTPALYVEAIFRCLPVKIPDGGAPGSEIYALVGGSGTQTITIADKFLDDLLCYVMARAELKNSKFADAARSTGYGQQFLGSLNAQVQVLTGVNPNLKTLPGGTEA